MRSRSGPLTTLVLLGFLGFSCSSTTGGFTDPEDAATTELGQDVPSDTPPPRDVITVDLPRVDVPSRDLVFTDVFSVDLQPSDVSMDLPPRDVPPRDVSPADLPTVDVPAGMCTGRVPPPGSLCSAEMCGNNRVDTCRSCGPCGPFPGGPGGRDGGGPPGPPPPFDAGTCCTDHSEACDGTELGGRSCTSLGYPSGTLRCSTACSVDVSDCSVCAPTASIVRCGRVAVTANAPTQLALAVTDSRVALAWVSDAASDGTGGALGFAVLSAALDVIITNPCVASDVTRVALAATPRGWLLAAQNSLGLTLYSLSPDGFPVGAVRSIPRGTSPILAPAPDGRALLVYVTYEVRGSVVSSVVLNPDALAGSATATLLSTVTEPEYGSAVYARDGWLVALRERGITVIPVANDGSAGTVVHPTHDSTEYPQVGYNGASATLTWSDFGSSPPGVRFSLLDPTGRLSGSTLTLGSIPLYFNVSPTARIGSDTVVLMSGYTGGTGRARRLDLQRVSPAATISGGMTALTSGPESHMNYRIAPIGTDVVVAWLAVDTIPGRITLARVHP